MAFKVRSIISKMAKRKLGTGFSNTEVWATSQFVYMVYNNKHRNSVGEVIYDKYTISASTAPAQNWQRETIIKMIKFLQKESLIKIHSQSRQDVNGEYNIAYETTLTPKGINAVLNLRFHDYFREADEKEYEKKLSITEKKANIYLPVISIIISMLLSWYTSLSGSEV